MTLMTHMRTRLLLIMSLESSGTSSQSMPCSAMARQGDSCWVWRWRQYVLDKQRQHGSIHLLNPSCHYFKLNLSCHYLKLNLSCHYFKFFGVWILQAKYKDVVSHNGPICQASSTLYILFTDWTLSSNIRRKPQHQHEDKYHDDEGQSHHGRQHQHGWLRLMSRLRELVIVSLECAASSYLHRLVTKTPSVTFS